MIDLQSELTSLSTDIVWQQCNFMLSDSVVLPNFEVEFLNSFTDYSMRVLPIRFINFGQVDLPIYVDDHLTLFLPDAEVNNHVLSGQNSGILGSGSGYSSKPICDL